MNRVSNNRLVLAREVRDVPEEKWGSEVLVPIVDRYVHGVLERKRRILHERLDAAKAPRGTLEVLATDGGGRRPLSAGELDLGLPAKADRLAAAFQVAGAPAERLPQVLAMMLRRPPPRLYDSRTSGGFPRRRWSAGGPVFGTEVMKPQVFEADKRWWVYWTVEASRVPDGRHHFFNNGQVEGQDFTLSLEMPGDEVEIAFEHARPPHEGIRLRLTVGEMNVVHRPMRAEKSDSGMRHSLRLPSPLPAHIFLIFEPA